MAFTTRHTLLQRIKSGEGIGWDEFEESYKKLVFLRAKDRGIHEDEKEDLLQNVMLTLFKYNSVLNFSPSKGRFRDYLKKIIDRQAFRIIRSRKTNEVAFENLSDGFQISSEDHEKAESKWENEWKNHLLMETIEIAKVEVSEITYEAFCKITLDEEDPAKVAKDLGISLESVYVAKHRFIKRLKPIYFNMASEM